MKDVLDKYPGEGQIYNFLPRNREFASKQRLAFNLLSAPDNVNFFPRCFDLATDGGQAEFTHFFKWTKVLSLLKLAASTQGWRLSEELVALLVSLGKRYTLDRDGQIDENEGLTLNFPAESWERIRKAPARTEFEARGESPRERILLVGQMLAAWEQVDPQFSLVADDGYPLFVVKPGGSSRGRGVEVLNSLEKISEYFGESFVVQKYIEEPFLWKDKKFDVRQWALITAMQPLGVWLYEEAYLRFSMNKYNKAKVSDRFVHLTNNSVSKKSKKYSEATKDETMMGCFEFEAAVNASGVLLDWRKNIQRQIKHIVHDTLQICGEGGTAQRSNSFELVGFDFMVDKNLKVWLLEVNMSPDLSYSTATTQRLVASMFGDMCKVLLDIEQFGKSAGKRAGKKWGPKLLSRLDSGKFTLLRPVLRRQEESMDLPPATVLTSLKLNGLAMALPRRAKVAPALAPAPPPQARRLVLADSEEDENVFRAAKATVPRLTQPLKPMNAVVQPAKKKPTRRNSFLPPIAQLGVL